MVTKFVGQILATKFGFVPDWWAKTIGIWTAAAGQVAAGVAALFLDKI